jgi:inner membrane protein
MGHPPPPRQRRGRPPASRPPSSSDTLKAVGAASECVAIGPGEWTAIGFLMFGLVLIVFEIFFPGFFIAVPGGALFMGGALALAFPWLMFESAWAWLLWPVLLGIATYANVMLYKRWSPASDRPLTLTADSLPGETALVVTPIDTETLTGKVRVKGQVWSARTEGVAIPAGTTVRIVRSEGVHVVVEPIPTATP